MLARESVNESIFSIPSDYGLETEFKTEDTSTFSIIKQFYVLGVPLALATLAQITFISVILAVIGRYLGITEMGGASLALGLINATAFAFSAGLCGALETFLSQAYGLFQKKQRAAPESEITLYMYGTYVQRMKLILLVVSVPLGFILVFADSFLELIGEKSEVVQFTGRFCRLAVFGIPNVQIFQLITRYYACQHITTPLSVAMIIASICNPILQIICIQWMGFEGSPIAWVFMFLVINVGLFLYTYYSGRYKLTWNGWDEKALKNMNEMCKLAIPSMAMMLSEWVALEINCIAAGFAEPIELAAFTITLQVIGFLWGVGSGIIILVCVFIGNAIGEGKPLLAKRIAKISIFLALSTALCNICICLLLEDFVPKLFTREEAVVVVYRRLVPLVLPYYTADFLQSTVMSILRGCGMQKLGSVVIAIALWGIGLPAGFFMFFYLDYGIESLWIGLLIGVGGFGFPVYMYLVFFYIDWENLKAQEEKNVTSDALDPGWQEEQKSDALEKEEALSSTRASIDAKTEQVPSLNDRA